MQIMLRFLLCLCAFGFALLLLLIFLFVFVFVVLSVSPTRRTSVALKGTMQNECDWMNWRGNRHCDGDWGWDQRLRLRQRRQRGDNERTRDKRNETKREAQAALAVAAWQAKPGQGMAWQRSSAVNSPTIYNGPHSHCCASTFLRSF